MTREQWPTNGRAPASLAWQDDHLVDWAGGGDGWAPDGSPTSRSRRYSPIFDGAVVSPSGRYQVIYTEYGTKGLVLEDGEILRELNRSYYQSDVYLYPVTLCRLADGREVVVHCPDEYNVLEIETLDTGERLTTRTGEAADVFHSRLAVSPDGRWLLSAGWVWHPSGVAEVFDLDRALAEPASLDAAQGLIPYSRFYADVESACWLSTGRLACFGEPDTGSGDDPAQLREGELGVWSMESADWESKVAVEGSLGTLLPFGEHVLSLFEHSKLLDPTTGAVIESWPDLPTGNRTVAYGLEPERVPAVAVHPGGTRFAVASEQFVTVVDRAN